MIANIIKTVFLLGALSGLFLFLGNIIGGSQGLIIAFVLSLIMNGIAYFWSDKIVLNLYHAKPLDKNEYAWIYQMVADLCASMKLPMPKLWIINHLGANAFATGRNPSHASVAFTTDILKLLDRDELRGVIAHELSHIKNRDTLITTIAATIASSISYMAQMLQHALFWNTNSTRNGSDRKNSNPIVLLLIAIITPFMAMLIQLAISRSREFGADDTGAQACHDPMALASALEKLHEQKVSSQSQAQAATASLFIVNPFKATSIINLFSTHPPVQARIQRLHALYKKDTFI